jgi:maleylpyruvate isomerase
MSSERAVASGLLGESSARLVRTVDSLPESEWSAPSGLPGWTRADVVAHLALNAEALARCLRGLVAAPDSGESRTMYESDEARAAEIATLAAADPGEIRSRLMAATTILDDAIAAVPDPEWDTRVERTPGGRSMRAGSVPGMRLRELEIHHVDLDTGYSPDDWSTDVATLVLDAMSHRLAPATWFEVRPLDVDRVWVLGPDHGDDVPVVTGPAAAAAWWLTGRPPPDSLSCSRGELPQIEGW